MSFQQIQKPNTTTRETKKEKDNISKKKDLSNKDNSIYKEYNQYYYNSKSTTIDFNFSDIGIFEADKTIQRKPVCRCGDKCTKCTETIDQQTEIPNIQTKLKIGQPDDPLEREADIIAEQIVDMNPAESKRGFQNKERETINHTRSTCKEKIEDNEEELIQIAGKSITTNMQNVEVSNETNNKIKYVISEGGKPLDISTKEFMEARFGYDFTKVRVHTDERAADSADALDAEAYSLGYDLVFGHGSYAPWTSRGRKTLAHELTHIVQQSLNPIRNVSIFINPDSQLTSSENLSSHTKKHSLELRSSLMHSQMLYRQPKKSAPKKLRLEAHAIPYYDGGGKKGYSIKNSKKEDAKGCTCREGVKCVHATGTLTASFKVTTKTAIPKVPSGLKTCQQKRVKEAINQLKKHEQKHVERYQMYNGPWEYLYDLTLCEIGLERTHQKLFEEEERSRRKKAQAASDLLDPFFIDIDLDC